jgi:hypothetical protein
MREAHSSSGALSVQLGGQLELAGASALHSSSDAVLLMR